MLPSFLPKRAVPIDDEDEKPKRPTINRLAVIRALKKACITGLVYILLHEQYRTAFGSRLKAVFSRNPLRNVDPAYLDMTRSAAHSATLRPSVSFELNTLDATGLFPEWYGQPAQVGKSPFDYILPVEWRKKTRWSFVLPDGRESAQAELRELAKAIEDSSSNFSVDVNARETPQPSRWGLFGKRKPDIQIASENMQNGLRDFGSTRIRVLAECLGRNCTQQVDMQHGQITLARHSYELADILAWHKLEEEYGAFPMQLFAHLPNSADPNIYFPAERKSAVSAAILDVDGIMKVDGNVLETRPIALQSEASDYREATLCLFSSGTKRRMTREWVKAMLSGCVIVSDMPTESEEALEDFMVQYETGADQATISKLIEEALQDSARLKRQALHAFIYARQHFTSTHQIGRILQLVEQYKAGVRGYDFTMPFSLKCRRYEDGYRPGWCS